MNTLALASILLALQGAQKPAQKPKLSVDVFIMEGNTKVAVKEGDRLVGDKTFRVQVLTTEPVTSVELYVGEDLRESDTSVPYEFKIDSLAEEDGDLKVRFRAYTSEGDSAEKALTLKVDNGVSKGAAYHVEKGKEQLSDGKNDEAIISGRIALKAEKDSVPARILMARAHFNKGILDKAQKFAEDALASEPKNLEALAVLSSIKVQQAFMTVNRAGADRNDTLRQIREAFAGAVDARRKVVEAEIDRIGEPTADNLIAYADASFRAKRYNRAVQALLPAVTKDPKNTALANRLIYGYLVDNRLQDALKNIALVRKFGTLDAYTSALEAIALVETNKDEASDTAIGDALLNNPDSLGVQSAQAYIALKRNRTKVLGQAARALAKVADTRPETYYFLSALSNRQNNYEAGRKNFEKAIRAEPLDHDMYIEQGNEAILLSLKDKLEKKDVDFQLNSARAMFDTALLVRDSSSAALTGISLVYIFQKNPTEAVKYAEAATKASASSAAAWYTYAAALSAKGLDGRAALAKAGELDKRNLEGRSMPDAKTAWNYFNTGGRTPVITPPARG